MGWGWRTIERDGGRKEGREGGLFLQLLKSEEGRMRGREEMGGEERKGKRVYFAPVQGFKGGEREREGKKNRKGRRETGFLLSLLVRVFIFVGNACR